MVKKFGQTWRGEHWLKSPGNVDDGNRLPRGAAYARNGRAGETRVTGNRVVAKAGGSRPSPCKASLVVPPFFKGQVGRLMENPTQCVGNWEKATQCVANCNFKRS